MFHNPNALNPINPEWFWDISHYWWDSEEETFIGNIRLYDVIAPINIALTHTSNGNMAPDER
ncbi:hypothetical protein DGMP_04250 [Desulfomarina profundi]|uniref:Uncharacterized protein n=1 Tax=Desulfomarina profundi TaxID=2772557 RepID=A0A8D5FTS0_9BACT|nr:hypothetical protein DGMP_04250 [Desulfomarina profundi]